MLTFFCIFLRSEQQCVELSKLKSPTELLLARVERNRSMNEAPEESLRIWIILANQTLAFSRIDCPYLDLER